MLKISDLKTLKVSMLKNGIPKGLFYFSKIFHSFDTECNSKMLDCLNAENKQLCNARLFQG